MIYASTNYQKASIDRGYTDRLLKIDLSGKQISVEAISQKMRAMFVGGRGYCLPEKVPGQNGGGRAERADGDSRQPSDGGDSLTVSTNDLVG